MQPTPDRPMIINLPVTVEMSMPHVYANQIEYCETNILSANFVKSTVFLAVATTSG